MKQCIMDAADKAGSKVCSDNAKNLYDQYITNMAGNTLQLMCSDYDEESDKCQRVVKMPYDKAASKPSESLLKAFGDLLLSDDKDKH